MDRELVVIKADEKEHDKIGNMIQAMKQTKYFFWLLPLDMSVDILKGNKSKEELIRMRDAINKALEE